MWPLAVLAALPPSLWCRGVFNGWLLTVLASLNSLNWLPVALLSPPHAPWGRGVQLLLPALNYVLFPSLGHAVLAGFILGFSGSVSRRRSLPCFCCLLCVLPCSRLLSLLLLPLSAFRCRFSAMDRSRARSTCFFLRGLISASSGALCWSPLPAAPPSF